MSQPWVLIIADDSTPPLVVRQKLSQLDADAVMIMESAGVDPCGLSVEVVVSGMPDFHELKGEFADSRLKLHLAAGLKGVGQLHRFMMLRERPYAIFDVTVDSMVFKRRLVKNAIFYVRGGGKFSSYIPSAPPASYVDDDGMDAAQTILNSFAATLTGSIQSTSESRGIGSAILNLNATKNEVTVRCRGGFNFKLRDKDAEVALEGAAGKSWGRLVSASDAESWKVRISASANKHEERFVDHFDVPACHLRVVHNARCIFGQVATASGYVLPESFRHPYSRRLSNRNFTDISQDFADVPTASVARRIRRPVFYLDSEYPDHFGHVMTEVMGRIASFKTALRSEPRLGVLISTRRTGGLPSWEADLLRLAGISSDRVELIHPDEAIAVDDLWTSTPLWSQPKWIHPGLKALWDEIRTNAGGVAGGGRPLFSTRAIGTIRTCTDHYAVEELFYKNGFEVLQPAALSFVEQVRRFASAEVVAGFAGSNLFQMMFSSPGQRIVVAGESYDALNEYMIACVTEDPIHYSYHRSAVSHPQGKWRWGAFSSNFDFKLERDQKLKDILGSVR